MKERPILFSLPMVRAILDGRKTQTRRVLSIDHCQMAIGTHFNRDAESIGEWKLNPKADTPEGHRHHGYLRAFPGVRVASARCPYGVPGDRLWVRESLHCDDELGWCYSADDTPITKSEDAAVEWLETRPALKLSYPSIHMPRSVSRLTLEIVSVRVERVREITVADCYAEGFPFPKLEETSTYHLAGRVTQAHDWYHELWDTINANTHPWASNPWVWVVEFKKLDSAGGAA